MSEIYSAIPLIPQNNNTPNPSSSSLCDRIRNNKRTVLLITCSILLLITITILVMFRVILNENEPLVGGSSVPSLVAFVPINSSPSFTNENSKGFLTTDRVRQDNEEEDEEKENQNSLTVTSLVKDSLPHPMIPLPKTVSLRGSSTTTDNKNHSWILNVSNSANDDDVTSSTTETSTFHSQTTNANSNEILSASRKITKKSFMIPKAKQNEFWNPFGMTTEATIRHEDEEEHHAFLPKMNMKRSIVRKSYSSSSSSGAFGGSSSFSFVQVTTFSSAATSESISGTGRNDVGDEANEEGDYSVKEYDVFKEEEEQKEEIDDEEEEEQEVTEMAGNRNKLLNFEKASSSFEFSDLRK